MNIRIKLSSPCNIDDDMTKILDYNSVVDQLKDSNLGETRRYKSNQTCLSVKLKNVHTLDGKIKPRFSNLADGSIITLFDKTPYPTQNADVVCPHFVELKWANGCNFDCAWCYLNGTLRFRPMGKKPYLKDKDKIKTHLQDFLSQVETPTILNSGELSDSLAFENNGKALSKIIVPLFKTQNRHKLLILTKSANVKKILESEAQDQVIASFSINANEVAKRWEKKAPRPKLRIKAAKRLFDAGYTVRIRLDPMVPIENWESEYKEIIDRLFENFVPERVTLGSLRGLQSTINNSKDTSWVEYLDDRSNWGKKISFEKRFKMYSTIIEHLKKEFDYSSIGLCKETVAMWDKLGMNYKKIECNCVF
jgi:spore photoproduct lyase